MTLERTGSGREETEINRPEHLTRRHLQGPFLERARLWRKVRKDGALLLAPFRVTGQGAATARRRVVVGAGTRIGQFSWFSLVGDHARVEIGRDCTLSASLSVSARGTVVIGDGTAIGERCLVTDHGHDHMTFLEEAMTTGARPMFGWETSEPRPVVIGCGVHIGVNVVILPGVEIGDGAVIGANSVVTRSVPAYSVAAGVPAKVLRTFQADGAGRVERA